MNRDQKCTDFAPAGFGGHWREWHRGHGCHLDPMHVGGDSTPPAEPPDENWFQRQARLAARDVQLLPPWLRSHPPAVSGERPETGPMQFGDDWPGVFVRGDNASGIVATLMSAWPLVEKTDPMVALQLRGIMRLFDSCHASMKPDVQRAMLVRGTTPTPGAPR